MEYTTKSGDTWDTIARDAYGDEYHAGDLMEANPGHIGTFIFSAGEKVIVPTLEEKRDGFMPLWKFEAEL